MTEHSGLPVALSSLCENKALEERVLRQLDAMKANLAFDQRMVAIAYTGIQEAFMWANRAVFQPGRVKLPEDAE